MAQINLLNKTGSTKRDIGSVVSVIIAGVVTFAFAASIVYYAFLYIKARQINAQTISTQNKILKNQQIIKSMVKRDEIITRQGQLKELVQLYKNRLVWSNLIPEVARITLKQAKYLSLQATAEGKLDMQVLTTDLSNLDKFLSVFEDPRYNRCITDVKMTSLSRSQSVDNLETKFGLQVSYNPKLLKSVADGGSEKLCK
jgi:hypothetical protein